MSSRSIASSTLWQIGSQASMALLSAFSAKFVAIALSLELAGHYNSVYGYLQIFAILADFGLYAVSVREVSSAEKKERVLGALLAIRVIVASLALGVAVLIAWCIPAWRGTPLPLGIAITALVPFLTLMAGVLRTVFQIHYKMHYVFTAEVSQRVLTVSMMFAAIIFGVRGADSLGVFHYFLWVGPVGAVLLFALSLFYSTKIMVVRPIFEKDVIVPLFTKAVPYGIAFLCIALYRQSDLTLIALLREDFPLQNALYGFAMRVAEMTYLIPTFLLNSTLPLLSERSDRGLPTSDLLGRSLFALLAISGASALFSFFWSRPIMQVLTTDQYLTTAGQVGSDTALSLLALPMFCNAIVLFSFYVLLTKHAWKPLVWCMCIGVLVSVGLNILWIPAHGFVGAIHTSIVVQLLLAVLLFPQALLRLPVRFPLSYVFRLVSFYCFLGLTLSLTGTLATTAVQSAGLLFIGGCGVIALGFVMGLQKVFLVNS